MSKNVALILAAGQGKRMGLGINKQFIELKGKPVLYYTLEAFSNNKNIDEIFLVCAEGEVEYCRENVVNKFNFSKVKDIVKGGLERQDSVYNGLKAINSCDIVLIHDGARPFLTDAIIDKGIDMAKIHGACTCGVKSKDTIKIKEDSGFSKETLNRENTFLVQTPQCFKYDIILDCHKRLNSNRTLVTDDTMVVEIFNHKVYLYDGDYSNIKITTPEDMIVGESILNNRKNK